MEFRILGPLDVRRDGEPVAVTGRHRPKILAMLLLGSGAQIPMYRLVEALWERPPDTAKRQVQNSVAALRRILSDAGHDPIESVGDGYRIVGADVDVDRFHDLARRGREHLASGRHGDAHADLCAALDLWRGPALADLPGSVLTTMAAHLEEQRLAVVEDRLATELALGQYGRVLGEARRLLEENPYLQRATGLLMEALCLAGRAPEALRVYEDMRIRLAEELGTDPDEALRRLHLRILRQEATPGGRDSTEPPATPGAAGGRPPVRDQLPADVHGFVGRREHLATLDTFAYAAHDTAAPPVLLAGTGGVGKTGLAVHWAHRASTRRAFPDGGLHVDLQGFGGSPVTAADALRQLLRQLGVDGQRLPNDAEEARALLRERLERGRYLILLDDAFDAAQVRPVLTPVAGCLTVITSRDRMDGLAARERARRIFLDELPQSESETLVRQLVGGAVVAAEPQAVRRMVELCARLPLALLVAAAGFQAAHPDTTLTQYIAELETDRLAALAAGGDDATAVASVLSWSTSRLSEEDARRLCLVAVHPGPRMDTAAAAALLETSEPEARRLLRAFGSVSLCAESGPGRFGMHDLLREHALTLARDLDVDLPAARRRLLRHYTERIDAASPQWIRAELAALLACLGFPADTAIGDYAVRLGKQLADLACFRESHTAYLAARQHAEPGGLTWFRAAAGLARVAPLFGDDRDHASQAIAGFRSLGALDDVIVTLRIEAENAVAVGDMARNTALNQEALELARQVGDRRAEAEVLTAMALGYSGTSEYETLIEYATLGARLAREVGDRSTEANARQYLGMAERLAGRLPEAKLHAKASLRLHEELGDLQGVAQTHGLLGEICRDAGEYRDALRHCRQAVELQRRNEDSYELAVSLVSLGRAAHAAGEHRMARDGYTETRTLCAELGNDIGVCFADIGLAELDHDAGAHGAAIARFREVLRRFADVPYPAGEALAHEGLGRALSAVGDTAAARSHLTTAAGLYRDIGQAKAAKIQALADSLSETVGTSPRPTGRA
ncbi:DNA-binding SARP family transcriptional activator [Stackebrandtia albiflava]|uniref:DNA-binding SARP family transcriptional activator n=1 Tax=Stackebrandtia albiflava TaxID=406432 RepID=A0A562VDV7_9ACTN|nr:BTAD domain-containing putative transcriptional regulator [Stackebrandtia albiflava]TWJ16045.1 DNA-binding SARP family transcriptional activator [Stackebrandtia albiflava]